MRYIWSILFVLIGHWSCQASPSNGYPGESIVLSIDRSLYITGEEISLAGMLESEQVLSSVVYLEIITPAGEKINQMKLPIIQQHFQGAINIPEDVLSGYYYVRAYTKWMRNGSVADYAYQRIKLVNPRNDQILFVSDSLIVENKQESGKAEMLPSVFSMNKNHFQAREKIRLSVIPASHTSFEWMTIAMTPTFAMAEEQHQKKTTPTYSAITYFPDTRGLSLSGTVVRHDTAISVPYHLVNLHIAGEKDFMAALTDSLGRFRFALPEEYGMHELFLIAASHKDFEVDILVDQDFCNRPVHLVVPKFSLDAKEKESMVLMAQRQQLKKTFQTLSDSIPKHLETSKVFYGHAFKSIDFSFYVPLDSLEQYFTDLPSWVNVRKKKGKRHLSLVGSQTDLQYYNPLVMVDWVPVDDMERVLAIHPQRVEKIDIINQSYLHGDIQYGGIISIHTKKGDFGGLIFPKSGIYLNYQFYAPQHPKALCPQSFDNTNYWSAFTSVTSFPLEIDAPSTKASYTIKIQTMDKDGELGTYLLEFVVE